VTSHLETSELEGKASPGLWFAAIASSAIYVAISVSHVARSNDKDGATQVGSVLGAMLGALLWPLIIMWISSLWKRNRTQKRRVTVFFIASAALVGLQLAAIFAIVGVSRYLASAKGSEAKANIGAISRGAMAVFEREQARSDNPLSSADNTAGRRLCGSAAAVPREVPRRAAYAPSTQASMDWNTGDAVNGWRCLGFSMAARQYYQYTYIVGGPYKGPARGGPDPGRDGFEVAAEGDLNGDGVTSLFTRIGKRDAASGKMVLSPETFVDKEFE